MKIKGVLKTMSKIYCRKCNRLVERNHKCKELNNKSNYWKNQGMKRDIRQTKEWKKFRESMMKYYLYLDLMDFAQGKITVAKELHHIIGVREDITKVFDKDNVISLSTVNHKKVEGREELKEYLFSLVKRYNEGKLYFGCDKDKIFLK